MKGGPDIPLEAQRPEGWMRQSGHGHRFFQIPSPSDLRFMPLDFGAPQAWGGAAGWAQSACVASSSRKKPGRFRHSYKFLARKNLPLSCFLPGYLRIPASFAPHGFSKLITQRSLSRISVPQRFIPPIQINFQGVVFPERSPSQC